MRFFNYLAPRLDGLSLAVVATTRSGENVTPELARLAAGPESVVLRPRPLSTGATVRLCERRLGAEVAPEFAAACREATGGNPLFLEALLREVSERGLRPDASEAAQVREIGPAAVADAVLLRLADRPVSATALVRAVAVIGDGASLAEAALLAELTDEEAALAADLLITLEILRAFDGLEFTHPIVREAVYTDIGAHERAQSHARAAQILVETGGDEERVAAQIVEAEPAGESDRVELLRRVAADALSRGAPAAAVAWLGRALAEPPPAASRGEVLLELSTAKLRLGTPEAAIDQLTAAVELVRDPQLLSTSVRLLGGALTWSGNADRAVEAIGSVIDVLQDDERELALLLEADRAAYAQQGSLALREPVRGTAGALCRSPRRHPGRAPCAREPRVRAGQEQRVGASGGGRDRGGARGPPPAARAGPRRRRHAVPARPLPPGHGRAPARRSLPGADAQRRPGPGVHPGAGLRDPPPGMGVLWGRGTSRKPRPTRGRRSIS